MSALLPGSKESFFMGYTLRRSVLSIEDLSELFPHSGKPLKRRTPYSVLGSFRFLDQRRPYQRQRLSTTSCLLLQPSSERSRREVPKDEETNPDMSNRSPKAPPLFSSHTIEVPTEYLMKQVLHKLETSGRLMKWAIELSEFDIRYKPKTAIKGQVLADFVMEFTSAEPAENTQTTTDLPIWKLSVDEATKAQGSGAWLILTSSEGIDIEYALRFGFQASNNEAEYEAVIAGLNLAHSMEVDQLEVCSDSQLVVRQIDDAYEAKGEKMILYLKKVRDLLKKFVLVQVRHIPRAENS